MAVLIAILGGTAIVSMPVDIFPYIDIPIVSVLWVYQGLSPEEMEKHRYRLLNAASLPM
jgi:multidrug efflux pump subunit AcrB